MNKVEVFLKRHSSTILTVVGSTGVIVTTVLAVKATPKALRLLEDARTEKGGDLTTIEKIKVAWKLYIPSAATGFATIACIFGINCLNTRNQASLMSAYALLDNAYKEYQHKVDSVCGTDIETSIRHEIIRSKYEYDIDLDYDELLFYDYQTRRFFKSTMQKVLHAENTFKEAFVNRGYACLNEYYDYLGIPHVNYGYQLGWLSVENNDPYNCKELEFEYEEMSINENLKCWIITTNLPPSTDYII